LKQKAPGSTIVSLSPGFSLLTSDFRLILFVLDSNAMSLMTHLECTGCAKNYSAAETQSLCECGSTLFARYDLRRASTKLEPQTMKSRSRNLWRYREVLPVAAEASVISLGEGFTPLLRARRLGDKLGLPNLFLKDESQNPTGSFKARGMAVAVSKAHELGIRKLAVPSAGNAGGALAAYAAKAGMEAAVYMPEVTPLANRLECQLHSARSVLVPGSIKDCGRAMREGLKGENWFDMSTLREPYRVEGKKTMAYEVCEQMGGRLPDVMIYPTGGGTGLIGMWKAFDEMQELGWITDRRPRMFAIQAHGCAPLVRAYAQGVEHAQEWKDPQTVASGLRVPGGIGDFLILRAVRKSRGAAFAVSDAEMLVAVREIAETEGLLTSPEGGATLAGLKKLLADGFLGGHESIVLFVTATGYKYLETLEPLV
jgi:threonine synthase